MYVFTVNSLYERALVISFVWLLDEPRRKPLFDFVCAIAICNVFLFFLVNKIERSCPRGQAHVTSLPPEVWFTPVESESKAWWSVLTAFEMPWDAKILGLLCCGNLRQGHWVDHTSQQGQCFGFWSFILQEIFGTCWQNITISRYGDLSFSTAEGGRRFCRSALTILLLSAVVLHQPFL